MLGRALGLGPEDDPARRLAEAERERQAYQSGQDLRQDITNAIEQSERSSETKMSEGSFWPKTWREAVPLLVWGVLIFAFGFQGVDGITERDPWKMGIGFGGMVGLTAMLIHAERIKKNFRDVRWLIAAGMLALVVVSLSPYVEQRRLPFAYLFDYGPPPPTVSGSFAPTFLRLQFNTSGSKPQEIDAKNVEWTWDSYNVNKSNS